MVGAGNDKGENEYFSYYSAIGKDVSAKLCLRRPIIRVIYMLAGREELMFLNYKKHEYLDHYTIQLS